jgi:demethoxyubiquinone hydroxylase (CLK1/Coq7/Cat5 family)
MDFAKEFGEAMTNATTKGPKYLPGDTRAGRDVSSMLRVNLAGEYGAKRIYEGPVGGARQGA